MAGALALPLHHEVSQWQSGEVGEMGSFMVPWCSCVMTVLGCLHENKELSICKYSVLRFLQLYAILQYTWANTRVLDFNK